MGMWDREEKAAVEDCSPDSSSRGPLECSCGETACQPHPSQGAREPEHLHTCPSCRGMRSGASIPRCLQPVLCKGRVALHNVDEIFRQGAGDIRAAGIWPTLDIVRPKQWCGGKCVTIGFPDRGKRKGSEGGGGREGKRKEGP